MTDKPSLVTFLVDEAELPRGIPLVAGLTGFIDSGSVVSQFTEYLSDTLDSTLIATFDTDELLDYRARRPTMYFDQDHFTGYESPRLAVFLMRDDLDQQFYFLTGFEPDFRWERFCDEIIKFADRFEISVATWVHAIPMPAPHTRPLGVTVSGSRRDLVEAMSVWRPHTQVPGNAMHLVEYHLHRTGHAVAGFVVLVPHYLADSEYPAAALVALQSITAATGLIFPTDRLRGEAREFDSNIDSQVQDNEELASLVGKLEVTYDDYMKVQNLRSPFMNSDGDLPSADRIAAELEDFLAMQRRRDDGADGVL